MKTNTDKGSAGRRLAIVILNWNGARMLRQYLPSVLNCSADEGVEVIVADNASTDDSVVMMEQDFPRVRTIVLDANYGFAEGYNRALAQVDARYYLLLNSDVEIHQMQWIRPLLDYMDAHEDVAACQPKLLSLRDPGHFEYAGACGGFIDKHGYPFCRGRLLDRVERDHGQYDGVADVLWATGAALLIRAQDWRESGGLDGRFFAHMEEIDLCWRLRTRGRRVVCIPQSTAYHLGGATLNQGNPHKTFLNHRNNLLMLYKNLPEDELHRTLRARWWLDRLTALQYLLRGDVVNAKAVMAGRKAFRQMRPSYEAVRRENLQRMLDAHPQGRMPYSLLWRYYVMGQKTYCSL